MSERGKPHVRNGGRIPLMRTSLVLQGPFSTVFFAALDHYLAVFDDIIISGYHADLRWYAEHWPRLNHPRIRLGLSSNQVPPGINNHGNAWYQHHTTAAGVRAASGEFVVKARMDERYSNMQAVVAQLQRQPRKFHTLNLYFRKDSELKFHVSDHLYGGHRNLMLSASETVVRWCGQREDIARLYPQSAWSECMLGMAMVLARVC